MDTTETEQDEIAGSDILVGARAIRAFLVHLGMPKNVDPYYLKRISWPIGSTSDSGGKLIASKRRLSRYTQKIAAG
jgi:hypothetical protein